MQLKAQLEHMQTTLERMTAMAGGRTSHPEHARPSGDARALVKLEAENQRLRGQLQAQVLPVDRPSWFDLALSLSSHG